MNKEGIKVTCKNCGYQWIYRGRLWHAICPNCRKFTPTGLGPKAGKEGEKHGQ